MMLSFPTFQLHLCYKILHALSNISHLQGILLGGGRVRMLPAVAMTLYILPISNIQLANTY